jgi:stalled ribosome alternative rescue factor ArfA
MDSMESKKRISLKRKRNILAKILQDKLFRDRVVPGKKPYKRKKSFNHLKEYTDE